MFKKNNFSKCKQRVDLEKCIKYIATAVVHRSWRHCGGDKCVFPMLSMEGSQVSWEVWCDIGVLLCSIKVLEQTPFSV